ncbi:MAG: hypothetical protein V1870_00610 [Candidatus Aenigmatarchaeota archaeon]
MGETVDVNRSYNGHEKPKPAISEPVKYALSRLSGNVLGYDPETGRFYAQRGNSDKQKTTEQKFIDALSQYDLSNIKYLGQADFTYIQEHADRPADNHVGHKYGFSADLDCHKLDVFQRDFLMTGDSTDYYSKFTIFYCKDCSILSFVGKIDGKNTVGVVSLTQCDADSRHGFTYLTRDLSHLKKSMRNLNRVRKNNYKMLLRMSESSNKDEELYLDWVLRIVGKK